MFDNLFGLFIFFFLYFSSIILYYEAINLVNGLLFLALSGFASSSPILSNSGLIKISNLSFDCTVTAYGLYQEPDGSYTDVRCTVTTSDCTSATAAAQDCRNQNVCNRVRANGGTPPMNLGCKQSTFEDP